MPIQLNDKTKNRISTVNAPKPPADPKDPNIGKVASMKSGVYAGLQGILYPRQKEVYYDVSSDTVQGRVMGENKQYLLKLFFDDGTFFCAVPADPADLDVVGGYTVPISGSGTASDHYPCGVEVKSGYGSSIVYHSLPSKAGRVTISYDFYGAPDSIDVYFANNPTVKVATTGVRTGVGTLTFDYNPAINGDKVIIKVSGGITGTQWQYRLDCPQ